MPASRLREVEALMLRLVCCGEHGRQACQRVRCRFARQVADVASMAQASNASTGYYHYDTNASLIDELRTEVVTALRESMHA